VRSYCIVRCQARRGFSSGPYRGTSTISRSLRLAARLLVRILAFTGYVPVTRNTRALLMRRATLVLLADVVFGLVLLGIAFAGLFRSMAPTSTPASSPGPPQLVEQFSGIMPPGQSTGFAVARDGSLAIVDRGSKSILRLDANGRPQTEWSVPGAIDLVGIAQDGDE